MFLECGEFGEFFCRLFCLNSFKFFGFIWLFIGGLKLFCMLNNGFFLNKFKCGFILILSECVDFKEFGERGL